MNFSTRIRDRRKQLAYTLQDVAELTTISERTLRKMENGNFSGKLENWMKVLHTLGLEFEIKVRPMSYEKG